jgi:hypothetical protein
MKKFIQFVLALTFLAGMGTQVMAQCTNSSSFGSATINPSGSATTISTCSWAGEYSTINGAVSGQTLKFTSSVSTDVITIHSGTPSGPVVGFGTTPLTINNTFTGTLYAHWNTPGCGSQNVCRTTTVQCTSCLPAPAPANDLCANAASISCGASVSGSTVSATPDAAPTCVTSVDAANSVWYKFVGTGTFATASLCNSGTNYDTKLHVYTGNCGALSCVTGDDDFCGFPPGFSQATWCAQQGVTYLIRVSGFGSAQGNFQLTLNCVNPTVTINPVSPVCATAGPVTLSASHSGGTFSGPGVSGNVFTPSVAGVGTHTITYTICSATATTTITVLGAPANDNCSGALAIGCNSSVSGSTRCATVDGGLPFCGTTGGTAPGVWYKFTGDGSFATLRTCNAGTNYDTKLHVFDGSCGNFTCVAGNDDDAACTTGPGTAGFKSRIDFCTQAGHTYYVLVHGFSSGVGEFQLDMSCNTPLTVEAGACQSNFVGYEGTGSRENNIICPTISGGTGPYTVTISPAALYQCDNGCYAVDPSVTTTYTITVTDANGCSTSDQVTVNVYTVSGPGSPCATPGNTDKVQICHKPPGNPANEHNLCVGSAAVASHLAHGDYLGPCGNTCLNTNPACAQGTCGGSFTVTISGAGFLDETTWSFAGATGGPYLSGSTNSTTVNAVGGPFTFNIETQGTFNDNVATYTITCSGNVVLTGTIGGGQNQSVSGICCDGMVAPKAGDQPQASNFAPAGGIVAFPNPFNDVTTFRFRSSISGVASVTIFTLAGKEVAQVFNGAVEAQGLYEVPFNAEGLSDGVYLYRFINAEGKMSMGKVSLMK